MVKIKEHKDKMEQVKQEIQNAKGLHKKDLIRQYAKLKKELLCAMMYLSKGSGINEKSTK